MIKNNPCELSAVLHLSKRDKSQLPYLLHVYTGNNQSPAQGKQMATTGAAQFPLTIPISIWDGKFQHYGCDLKLHRHKEAFQV